mgnify:CR=1 FL=1
MINFIYITTSDKEEAKSIGSKLVEERLAACVNIIDGMTSMFWWQGQIDSDNETILIAKTDESLNDKLMNRVHELHSYDCPCTLVIPIKQGNQGYMDWLYEQVGVTSPS